MLIFILSKFFGINLTVFMALLRLGGEVNKKVAYIKFEFISHQ